LITRPPTHRHLHSFPTRRSSDLRSRRLSSESGRVGCLSRVGGHTVVAGYGRSQGGAARGPATGPSTYKDDFARPIVRLLDLTARSEEHTSELQSLRHLVCRLLLE